jgi:two-component system cell cycle response regulator
MQSPRTPPAVKAVFVALGVWLAAYEAHLLIAAPFASPLFNRYVHDAVLLTAASLCGLRALRRRPERLAWALIAGALLSWTVGEIYYTLALWTAKSIPVPSPADIGYLGVYPLAFSGLMILLRDRARRVGLTLWVDGVIAALVVGALGAAVVFEEVLKTIGGRPISIATNLAYPLGDLLLLGIIATGFTLRRWRPDRSALLLGLGIVAFWTADSLYLVETAQNTYTQGGIFDAGWWAGITLVALAAWQPTKPMPERARRENLGTIFAPISFAVVGLGLLVYATLRHVDALAVGLATAALLGVIVRLIITFRENIHLLQSSRREALTDALTGLGNRRHLMVDLERRCSEEGLRDPFDLVLFDLDGFKLYNDRFGHPAGDALLVRLSDHFRNAIRPYGSAYRMGGDEFCALIESGGSKLESVISAASIALSEDGEGFDVKPSYGTVLVPAEASSAGDALGIADARLYQDKDQRRVRPHDEMQSALLQVLRERHPDLHRHLSEVACLSRAVCQKMGLAPEEIDEVVRAAELHDVGKMAIPDTILDKPGPLNRKERAFMERHTVIGQRILAAAPALETIAGLVRSSHERYDGDGYPDSLAGDRIPLGSRIVFACDAFNAMTTDRPYASRKSHGEALSELRRCAGTQFDPQVVAALAATLEADPSGGLAPVLRAAAGSDPRVTELARSAARA